MSLATWFISSFLIVLSIVLAYYFLIEKPRMEKKPNNVIELQTDGFDFILYQGKVKELVTDYNRYLADMDIVIYSKSIFIGSLEPKYAYLEMSAKSIHGVKYEPNKILVSCCKELCGTSKLTIKGNSTKELYMIAKKIDFISRRSKKVKAM